MMVAVVAAESEERQVSSFDKPGSKIRLLYQSRQGGCSKGTD